MIYFVQRESDNAIKIGFSDSDLHQRVGSLRIGAGPSKCLGVMLGDRSDEQKLHAQFGRWRIGGEWFRPTPRLMALIKAATDPLQAKPKSHKGKAKAGRAPKPWRRGDSGGAWYAQVHGRQVFLAGSDATHEEADEELQAILAIRNHGPRGLGKAVRVMCSTGPNMVILVGGFGDG